MPPKQPLEDRDFTGLTRRFKRNIYDSPKGQLRLAILERDFTEAGIYSVTSLANPLNILDVGAGQGQFALQLAQQGHRVRLSDVSQEMLAQAQIAASAITLDTFPSFEVIDLWALAKQKNKTQYDVVTCHAVLEWLEEPLLAIDALCTMVKPCGYLSLLFYNVHGLVFKNLLRSNYKKVIAGDVRGQKGSLTPINPQDPNNVLAQLSGNGMRLQCHSGVRVFHDYILNREDRARQPAEVKALELELSRKEPYRGLGRYVHVLAQKL